MKRPLLIGLLVIVSLLAVACESAESPGAPTFSNSDEPTNIQPPLSDTPTPIPAPTQEAVEVPTLDPAYAAFMVEVLEQERSKARQRGDNDLVECLSLMIDIYASGVAPSQDPDEFCQFGGSYSVQTPQHSDRFTGFHSVSAEELARAYVVDPAGADAALRGRDLSVTGTIHSVTHLYPGAALVLLVGHDDLNVGCFPGAWWNYQDLSGPVTMFGVGEGLKFSMGADRGVVSLTHCEVTRPGEPTPTGRPSPKPTP